MQVKSCEQHELSDTQVPLHSQQLFKINLDDTAQPIVSYRALAC